MTHMNYPLYSWMSPFYLYSDHRVVAHRLESPNLQLLNLDPRRQRWCGFCTVFAPVYEMLGRGTENVRSLKLYTFDLSENDAEPSLNVTAFPTVSPTNLDSQGLW